MGGAMRSERWIPVEPADYDEPHEVEALELEPGYFISPYDVPDGIRVTYDGELFGIYLRYLTDEEESRRTESDRADIHLRFGRHSNRLIGLEASSLPPWADVRDVLSAVRTRVNHFVAWTVLRDFWPEMLEEARRLGETGGEAGLPEAFASVRRKRPTGDDRPSQGPRRSHRSR